MVDSAGRASPRYLTDEYRHVFRVMTSAWCRRISSRHIHSLKRLEETHFDVYDDVITTPQKRHHNIYIDHNDVFASSTCEPLSKSLCVYPSNCTQVCPCFFNPVGFQSGKQLQSSMLLAQDGGKVLIKKLCLDSGEAERQ